MFLLKNIHRELIVLVLLVRAKDTGPIKNVVLIIHFLVSVHESSPVGLLELELSTNQLTISQIVDN